MPRYNVWRSASVWVFSACVVASSWAFAGDVAAAGDAGSAACCAVREEVAAANSREVSVLVWTGASLRNRLDPLTGKETSQRFFATYTDDENKVFARIYFASTQNAERAESADLKKLYSRAYLTLKDGGQASYGETRIDGGNLFCPVSGVGGPADSKLNLDKVFAVNCNAGACSVGDGFSLNYNAAKISVCCVACGKRLLEDPERFLANVDEDILFALKALSKKELATN